MGLFRKNNPAEEKLKELTGGLILSASFKDKLERCGLSINEGLKIQRQLKKEIKEDNLKEKNVELRLNQLINQKSNLTIDSSVSKKCPSCHEIQDLDNLYCMNCGYEFKEEFECPSCHKKQDSSNRYCIECGYDLTSNPTPISQSDDFTRKIAFLHNFDFNLKTCPECNTQFLKVDPFCFNCGASVVTKKTHKNDNLEVKDGKLVEKSDVKNDDELTGLEALYNQTVKSNYAPNFKVAYVLFLDAFKKNPTKIFPEKLAKKYDTTPKKLKKQAVEDEFIEPASPLIEARNSKVSDLKEILKSHNLKVSGKKDELIERLGENLSEEELKKYFKSKNYQISSKGDEFLTNNTYIIYLTGDKDISRVFHPSDMGKIFEEKEYSQDEIYDNVLVYFKGMLDKKLTNEVWVDFKRYSNAVAQVQEDKGDLKDALNTRFKVFLFDINNFSLNTYNPDPRRTKLKQKDMTKLVGLMHKLILPIDELKELFECSFNEVLFETAITCQDSLVYLLKVFGGEDLDSISKEINDAYSNPR